jgi:hypothetical protein
MNKVIELLEELMDFMVNKSDADFQGDPPEYIPNKEMRFAQEIRDVLETLNKSERDTFNEGYNQGFAASTLNQTKK